ncbi:hypothetical protein LIPSTDRAFT_68719 [Lipomyces starkeyi NRRL Y-11557]|uniref:Uncharacterized protein n=1 Tax=Lipomyces starkeyi NRRL Y-11557 TaxID=675824 RepID=A0A1E3QEJ9_LIPST|nr:hypothetical protein LIPSTDRAFT_68719 [Lipomyces starkeyi NRRL Y-11557]
MVECYDLRTVKYKDNSEFIKMREEKYTRRTFYLKFTLRYRDTTSFIVSPIVYYRILLRYSIAIGSLFTSLGFRDGMIFTCKKKASDVDMMRPALCCASHILSQQPDFRSQPSRLEPAVRASGHLFEM